jgi:hypothetical protein
MKSLTIYAIQKNAEHFLTFEWNFFNGIQKTNSYYFMDSEVLNAIFDDTHCSFLKMKPKLMLQIFDHLSYNNKLLAGEILLIASPNSFAVRSYHSQELQLQHFQSSTKSSSSFSNFTGNDPKKAKNKLLLMNTGLSIHLQEFDSYEYHSEGAKEEMIFTMKEVGSFVTFCEINEFDHFDFYYSSGGK